MHEASGSEASGLGEGMDTMAPGREWNTARPTGGAAALSGRASREGQRMDRVNGAFVSVALARLERDHVALLAAICQLDGERRSQRPDGRATLSALDEALLTVLREDLRQTQRALARAAEGQYGYCETCNAALSVSLLLAQPATTQCKGCAGAVELSGPVH